MVGTRTIGDDQFRHVSNNEDVSDNFMVIGRPDLGALIYL